MNDTSTLEAEHRARVLAADWHAIPAGYYAIPIHEWDDEDNPVAVLAYRLFRRTAARTTKNGKQIGEDGFIAGVTLHHPGADPQRVREELDLIRDLDLDLYGPRGPIQSAIDDIVSDLNHGDTYRANYGRFTGKCGCCGRRLTDPESKLRGIGPECRGDRKH